ncbi:hypothetical protein F5Y05DRAFT_332390 [Hypoxylon sp. FL0543]|nr:hypothetical protein F5Y05DRAFT_332390 [Hypoxylon sp. FL0543]
MSSTDAPAPCLQAMPAETLLKIMELSNPSDVTSLSRSAKVFYTLFDNYKASTMRRSLQNLPEFDLLLYLYTSNREELQPSRLFHPRVIDCETTSGTVNLMDADNIPRWFTGIPVPMFTFTSYDFEELWKRAKVIDWWVEMYPRLRWRDAPEDRRCLRPAEDARLRKAVARWWLYAHYHHGFSYWHRSYLQPKKWDASDTRLMQVRLMPTSEIRELADLWCRVRDTVSKDLCSSPERVCLCKDGYGVDLVPWGADEGRHSKIVRTYMKLDPEQLQYYLIRYSNWKKTVTIDAISGCSKDFSRDTETLSVALNKVLEERMDVKGVAAWRSLPRFGILDEDRADEQQHAEWLNDRWLDGRVPLDLQQIATLPQDTSSLVCRGDDGTDAFVPF